MTGAMDWKHLPLEFRYGSSFGRFLLHEVERSRITFPMGHFLRKLRLFWRFLTFRPCRYLPGDVVEFVYVGGLYDVEVGDRFVVHEVLKDGQLRAAHWKGAVLPYHVRLVPR
jgi:hypothetical protein